MNVLMIGPDREKIKGGMSSVIKNYIDSKLSEEINIIPISTVSGGNKIGKIFTFINSYMKTFYNLAFKGIDITHIHVASRNSFIRKSYYIRLAKRLNSKIVIHMHGGQFDKFYWNESNDRRKKHITNILNKADVVIALGERWEKSIKEYCDSEIVVIPNSINVNKINLYNKNSNNILFIGRLEKDKGIYDLINAFKKVVSNIENINLILAGDGEKEKVNNILEKYGLTKNVVLKGWVNKDEIDRLLGEASLFLLPSYDEGMPISILEAMSFGVPIISTNVGSIPEVITDENGILINPGDVDKLSDSIEFLFKDENLRNKISNNNYKKIIEEYNTEINNNKLLNLYKEILG